MGWLWKIFLTICKNWTKNRLVQIVRAHSCCISFPRSGQGAQPVESRTPREIRAIMLGSYLHIIGPLSNTITHTSVFKTINSTRAYEGCNMRSLRYFLSVILQYSGHYSPRPWPSVIQSGPKRWRCGIKFIKSKPVQFYGSTDPAAACFIMPSGLERVVYIH